MNSLEKSSRTALLLLPMMWVQAALCQSTAAPVIYKHVDENGRVTYTNQPVKGAAVVDLAPLMVVPSGTAPQRGTPANANVATVISPQSVQANAVAPVVPVAVPATPPVPTFRDLPSPVAASADETKSQAPEPPPLSAETPQPKIRVLPLPVSVDSAAASPTPAVIAPLKSASTLAPAPRAASTAPKTGQTPAMMVQQRREEVRRRILEGEIEAENELLAEARESLTREQKKSAAMRALREAVVKSEKPVPGRAESDDNQTTKALVERHFQRVRDLQDQVAMHDQNLIDLRSQLSAVGVASKTSTARAATGSALKPVALVSTTPPGIKAP